MFYFSFPLVYRCTDRDADYRAVYVKTMRASPIAIAPPPQPKSLRIDFGDGEVVQTACRGQADFLDMLASVGAAGIRRRAANGFPVHAAPLIRSVDDSQPAHDYLAWPRPFRESHK